MKSKGKLFLIVWIALMMCTDLSLAEEEKANEEPSARETAQTVIQLDTIVVTGAAISDDKQEIESRTLKSHKVVDLAEILSDELVEVQMIRKSGYGNEVSMRGFGQENMKVLLDGGILEGACGSRKDPSLSHTSIC